MGFVVGKCGFTQKSMGYLIEIRRIPDDSSVDSLDLGIYASVRVSKYYEHPEMLLFRAF